MDAELVCEFDGEFPATMSSVVVRPNEIGVSHDRPNFAENVLGGGRVVSREYRGALTDHRIAVGATEIVVSTQRFCSISEGEEAD